MKSNKGNSQTPVLALFVLALLAFSFLNTRQIQPSPNVIQPPLIDTTTKPKFSTHRSFNSNEPVYQVIKFIGEIIESLNFEPQTNKASEPSIQPQQHISIR